ncbi:hypothetical protein [Kitasatospora sp. A2-31]|uniref:hypothetical protein n=1 Tax=Kitasatospora sp. A2-31 TaxID=2916414 RepID=UPI001EEC66AC|nr:hypothetical protein [Kitasatospora sp. A2-31]MCG6496644.1 hypothetical protein [Kitasatospora sp. A2-31]
MTAADLPPLGGCELFHDPDEPGAPPTVAVWIEPMNTDLDAAGLDDLLAGLDTLRADLARLRADLT